MHESKGQHIGKPPFLHLFHTTSVRQHAWELNLHPSIQSLEDDFIIREGRGEPERACIADLMFCLAHKPWITAGFVTAAPRTRKAKLHAAISPVKEVTTATHILGLNFTMKSQAESLALMSVIMDGPYLKRTQLLCVTWRYHLWAACTWLSWSAVTFSRSISVELDSERFVVSTFMREP